jgi:hypothetical protein
MKGDAKDYIAQVWQAVLAQTPEIILWCAGQLSPSNPSSDVYPDFVKMLPEFDRIAGLLKGETRGIPIYLPYGSVGEYNIFGYLGMCAIPLVPVAEFPTESKNAIFTLHSLSEGSLGQRYFACAENARSIAQWKRCFYDMGALEKTKEYGI